MKDINPPGFQDKQNFATIDHHSDKIRVMILGDSFMLGAGVKAAENMPSVLQRMLEDKYQVFNLGMGGWGIDQMYLAYRRFKDILRPHVVMLAFIDEDVDRVLEAYRVFEGMTKPSFVIRDGWQARFSRFYLEKRVASEYSNVRERVFQLIYAPSVSHNRCRPVVEHIFLQIAQETQRENQKFAVVRIPTTEDALPIRRLIGRLYSFKVTFKSIDAQYLEPWEEMIKVPNWAEDFYLSNEGHMSVAGNRYLAEYIYRRVFKN